MCLSDDECVRRCLDGHPDAFRHLVVRHQGPLQRYLVGRLGNEERASEAAQDTFVRAYFALRKLNKPGSFFSWLLGIAGRVAQETHRDQRRRRQVALVGCEPAEMVLDHADSADTAVMQAVAELPDVYRQVVLLRYYRGLSCAEASSALGVPLGTVTKRLSRAYALLRKALQEQQQSEDGM